jgi:hypothetical protein
MLAVLRVILRAVQQRIADADVRLGGAARLGKLAQRREGCHRRQHGNGLARAEPRRVAVLSWAARDPGLRRPGDEHAEWQARQRPRRHDEQVLVLDHILDRAEQGLVEGVRALQVEGQDVDELAGDVELIAVLVQQLNAPILGLVALP